MPKLKKSLILLTIVGIIATGIGVLAIDNVDRQLQIWLETMGVFAPVIYIVLYTVGTLLILPSTPLNLTGGAIFGIWWGTLWTTLAALVAAIATFAFTRTIGRELVTQKLAGRWRAVDAEIRQGGLFYLFAIRLLPIIPYGIVNFVAGLTSIKFKDYLIGTLLGTLPGVLPFVMMGAGITKLSQGNILPLMAAFALTGILVGGATWYRQKNR
ncbi:MAG: TVP38/TMEM64 family protein [Pleurocapsa sp. SU_5_0]|nr:TVP38/TMEM64 family protein [Pleurocapsa sp. SU_5_0]NJO96972.1 TVP38/TMEM64 family protein [Pleurocapsa sp. CRU_1_2]